MRFGFIIVLSGLFISMLMPAAVGAYEAGEVSGGGVVAGVVKFSGTAPARAAINIDRDKEVCGKESKLSEELIVGADGGVQNAVVYLAAIGKGKAWPAETVTLDQNGCHFDPHVVLATPDTEMEVLNSDGILHNLHSYSKTNRAFNVAQPGFKKKMKRKFASPEFVKVACDAHGWMKGYIVVREHPYYAVTDEKGAFKLEDVPAGDYELKVWHETLGKKTQKVSVSSGGEAAVTFVLSK